MNILIIILMLMGPTKCDQTRWLISVNSSLSVNGSTNVNKFSCDIPGCDPADTLTVARSEQGITLTGSINPSTLSFDCHKAMMTHDLRKTLKAKKYPKLHIRFLSLSELPQLSIKPVSITGKVEIEIAGIVKTYTVNYQLSEDEYKTINLIGAQDLDFSDFKLVPPHKFGGLIKTKNQLTVAFHLKMKSV